MGEGERDVDVLVAGWKGGGEMFFDIEYLASILGRRVRLIVCVCSGFRIGSLGYVRRF